jgi:hypothetical protein
MRTEKRNAFLSGLCVVAVALGMMASSAYGDASTERGASILAFPKVLADGTSDTIIQITNISNNMVHARCFYVNAAPDPFTHQPIWQVTDFVIWLTKQQPTHWQVSAGRFENPADNCEVNLKNQFVPDSDCADAGIDPGAVPPVPENFVGELKCVEVDVSENPIGGNHLKGEATIKTIPTGDAAKYNAIGLQGTSLAGQTGNQLLLNQPLGSTEEVGEYDACPNVLLLNHFTEGVTDPFILAEGLGGTCKYDMGAEHRPCMSDADCVTLGPSATCENGPQILDPTTHTIALRSATLSDLTLIPCTEDFENSLPASATVQFQIFNEFEERFTASTTVTCWEDQFLFQIAGSPNNPLSSVFSFATLGTTVAHTRIIPVQGAVLGVLGTTRADSQGNLARVADNIHMEGDRFTGTNGQGFTDVITLSDIQ